MAVITQEYLKSRLNYEPDTGLFRWNETGLIACSPHDERGYLRINLSRNQRLYAHRLAFIYMTGSCPQYVDHIDSDKGNTRWANLRPATKSQNSMNRGRNQNNKCGVKGVYYQANGYVAEVRLDGVRHYLGRFKSIESATSAVVAARTRLHGDFARHV